MLPFGPFRTPKGLDVAFIRRAEAQVRASHVAMIRGYVSDMVKLAGLISLPTVGGPLSDHDAVLVTRFFEGTLWRRHYVRMWAQALGSSGLPDERLDELWPALQPAGEFLSRVLLQSLRDGYNFEKNANDVTDEAQLSYLCDPCLTFVTQDKKLRDKLSKQSLSRVITLEEFKNCLEQRSKVEAGLEN